MKTALCFGFLLVSSLSAKEPLPLEKQTFLNQNRESLPYRFLQPEKVAADTRYPLVIFLHGAGERGNDNEKQLIHGVPDFCKPENRKAYPCFLIAPQCPENEKWVDCDWATETHALPKEPSKSARLTVELIQELLKKHPIDPNRMYLTGLSMGGYGTWDLPARYPDLFAAAVPVCGGADESTAEKIKSIPIWAFHGTKDGVVKPIRSQRMIEALKKAGGNPKYTEYPTVGHDSWKPAYADPEMMKWLFAQTRKK